VIVQIYTAQSPAEAVALAQLGVDRVGITPADRGLPGEVSLDVAAEVVAAVGSRATTSALTVASDQAEILEMVDRVRADVLHLCAPTGSVPPEAVDTLRGLLPGDIEVMQAIAVADERAVDVAVAYAPFVDVILLDSVTDDVEGIGAAGVTHDWSVSRRIVETVDIPVVLAGGLSAANVAEAVAAVRPWGVDSLSHTNRPHPDGGFRKDLDAVEAFLTAARGA